MTVAIHNCFHLRKHLKIQVYKFVNVHAKKQIVPCKQNAQRQARVKNIPFSEQKGSKPHPLGPHLEYPRHHRTPPPSTRQKKYVSYCRYIAWQVHERVEGDYDFEGGNDFVAFTKIADSLGLLVIIRAGKKKIRMEKTSDETCKREITWRTSKSPYFIAMCETRST